MLLGLQPVTIHTAAVAPQPSCKAITVISALPLLTVYDAERDVLWLPRGGAATAAAAG
jgi:hypothetical protein